MVENNDSQVAKFYDKIYKYSNEPVRIGITGPPGAGKSTLVDKLISYFINDNKSVGVVAIDPSSPFSGGALLGDRVRMSKYSENNKITSGIILVDKYNIAEKFFNYSIKTILKKCQFYWFFPMKKYHHPQVLCQNDHRLLLFHILVYLNQAFL